MLRMLKSLLDSRTFNWANRQHAFHSRLRISNTWLDNWYTQSKIRLKKLKLVMKYYSKITRIVSKLNISKLGRVVAVICRIAMQVQNIYYQPTKKIINIYKCMHKKNQEGYPNLGCKKCMSQEYCRDA